MPAPAKTNPELDLIHDIASFELDPLGYVLYAFKWGEGELKDKLGPRRWQRRFLKKLGEDLRNGNIKHWTEATRKARSSGHGVGKALSVDTLIPTPSGSRRMGDLVPGDWVFGSDGQPTVILAVEHQGVRPSCKVRFDDDTEVVADEIHNWAVRGRQERRNKRHGYRVLTTKQIMDLGVMRPNGKALAKQWEIPIQEGVEGSIDYPTAYVIGVWLGDGAANRAAYTKPFATEVVSRIREVGFSVHVSADGRNHYVHGLGKELRRLGLFKLRSYERFIPEECFQWTARDRSELLRGLLDTDGDCGSEGAVVFASSSEPLLRGVMRLARSLGGKAQPQKVKEAYIGNVRHRDCHRATITMPDGFKTFYIARKAERVRKVLEHRYLARWIASIEPCGELETVCIQVAAPDSLFLANDYVVTHNSCLVAWLLLWAMSTFEDTRGVVTANTEGQLKTKTWSELAKWHGRAINHHWFTLNATSLVSNEPGHQQTWRIDAIAWSENNTEAFAGLHNEGKRIILVFDEASAIIDKIWEVAEGALTDSNTQIMWFAFGNPTRNTGTFARVTTGGDLSHRWDNEAIDSRDVEGTNLTQIAEWISDYGEDSDFVRVRVRGIKPRASDLQFIPTDVVNEAMRREAVVIKGDPLIMTLDVSRGGADKCVFRFRRGRDARSIPPVRIPGTEVHDSMILISKAVELLLQHKPNATFIDGTGVGGPVGDRLRQLGYNVTIVNFAEAAPNHHSKHYANMRAYMWAMGKDWLIAGGAIDHDATLEGDLTAPEIRHDKHDRILLESKDHMKARGLASPDDGDALMLSFAHPVAPTTGPGFIDRNAINQTQFEYDPYKGF